MPLGDSITDGYGTPGGYRIELFRKILTASQHATFVGRNSNGPGTVMWGRRRRRFRSITKGTADTRSIRWAAVRESRR
jgi:hypothetical protein